MSQKGSDAARAVLDVPMSTQCPVQAQATLVVTQCVPRDQSGREAHAAKLRHDERMAHLPGHASTGQLLKLV